MSQKKMLLALVVLSCLVMSFAVVPLQAQSGTRWTGADNNPTTPLDCPSAGGAAATQAAAAATSVAMAATAEAYNGGQAVSAPDKAGKPINLVDIPKLIGIGYFAATTKGEQEAATELGNVTIKTDG